MLSWYSLIVSQCRFDIGILVSVPRVYCFIFHFQLQFCNASGSFSFSLLAALVVLFVNCPLNCRVENAEVLCLGLVSVAVFVLVMPLFKSTAGVLLQMAPPSIHSSALNKCLRQLRCK